MEALERENNAKEALGMSNMAGHEEEDEEGTSGRVGGSGSSGTGGEAKTADKRLEALKTSAEKKARRGVHCSRQTCLAFSEGAEIGAPFGHDLKYVELQELARAMHSCNPPDTHTA